MRDVSKSSKSQAKKLSWVLLLRCPRVRRYRLASGLIQYHRWYHRSQSSASVDLFTTHNFCDQSALFLCSICSTLNFGDVLPSTDCEISDPLISYADFKWCRTLDWARNTIVEEQIPSCICILNLWALSQLNQFIGYPVYNLLEIVEAYMCLVLFCPFFSANSPIAWNSSVVLQSFMTPHWFCISSTEIVRPELVRKTAQCRLPA